MKQVSDVRQANLTPTKTAQNPPLADRCRAHSPISIAEMRWDDLAESVCTMAVSFFARDDLFCPSAISSGRPMRPRG
jgi:hypothetical protein